MTSLTIHAIDHNLMILKDEDGKHYCVSMLALTHLLENRASPVVPKPGQMMSTESYRRIVSSLSGHR